MAFEWDAYKAEDNRLKHRASFEEATEVFDDPLVLFQPDEQHAQDEDRFHAIGRTAAFRLLVVCYTMRGELIRLIGARPAMPKERRQYEQRQNP